MPWFIVTGRVDGQDEDGALAIQAKSAKHAMEVFEMSAAAEWAADHDGERPGEIYVNWVWECPPDNEPPTARHSPWYGELA